MPPASRPKPIRYERIDPSDDPEGIHALIRDLVRLHHDHLAEATIGAAFRTGLKRNPDGLLKLGQCHKSTDLGREFADTDFVVTLNAEAWRTLDASQRRALLDHELTHASVRRDKSGEIMRDERGRPIWRLRRHDLEEFRSIVSRHGCYLQDIAEFAQAVLASPKPPPPSLLDFLPPAAVASPVEPDPHAGWFTCEACGVKRPPADEDEPCPACDGRKLPTKRKKGA